MSYESSDNDAVVLSPWEPRHALRQWPQAEAKYSRGFLRCHPEKWFPAITTHWLPLAHSLGVEIRVTEVKPLLQLPTNLDIGYGGTVDGETLGLFCDLNSKAVLLASVVPSALAAASDVVMDYLARRFLGSLAMSWTGPESSVVQFDEEVDIRAADYAGAVRLSGNANGNPFTVWVGLGKALVDRFDGLWRRQVQSSARASEGQTTSLRLEVGQLAVPPTMLGDYLRAGTVIDLEAVASDQITLRQGAKAWMAARLAIAEGNFAIETLPGPVQAPLLPEGTTRLGIEFGAINLDAGGMAELSQAGAMYVTNIPATDNVQLVINNEVVGQATLCSYQGRFAITVS
ncbi:MAG: hypothetical protein K1X79_11765 [Oligoflexia bacterium]|nr:hypothetical protein [Oligoflexia bacterium]